MKKSAELVRGGRGRVEVSAQPHTPGINLASVNFVSFPAGSFVFIHSRVETIISLGTNGGPGHYVSDMFARKSRRVLLIKANSIPFERKLIGS